MTWVLVYLTKPCFSGDNSLMVYFRNDLFFGEFLNLICHFTQTCKIFPPVERIINFDVVLQFCFFMDVLSCFYFGVFLEFVVDIDLFELFPIYATPVNPEFSASVYWKNLFISQSDW